MRRHADGLERAGTRTVLLRALWTVAYWSGSALLPSSLFPFGPDPVRSVAEAAVAAVLEAASSRAAARPLLSERG